MAREVEQRIRLRDCHVQWAVPNLNDRVAAAYLALLQNPEVEAWPVMRYQECRHARFIRANADAITGDSWLRDFEESVADPVPVANADLVIRKAVDGEVLTELSKAEIATPELSLPVAIGIRLIDEDGALLTSVATQIALAIAVDVQPSYHAPALNRTLPHRGMDRSPFPGDIPRQTDVQ
jgi:hypothetical protein